MYALLDGQLYLANKVGQETETHRITIVRVIQHSFVCDG